MTSDGYQGPPTSPDKMPPLPDGPGPGVRSELEDDERWFSTLYQEVTMGQVRIAWMALTSQERKAFRSTCKRAWLAGYNACLDDIQRFRR